MPPSQEPQTLCVLSETQLLLIKKTLPLFEKNSYKIAVEMYTEVFKFDSNIRNLFSLDFVCPRGASRSQCPLKSEITLCEPLSPQARILSQNIVQLASNIEKLHLQQATIDRIGCKHVSRDVRPEHYQVVAKAFAQAMRTVLGSEITEAEHEAWNAAVLELAQVFIKHENDLRERARVKRGVSQKFHPQSCTLSRISSAFFLEYRDTNIVNVSARFLNNISFSKCSHVTLLFSVYIGRDGKVFGSSEFPKLKSFQIQQA
jgi:hemoglobin-like flavoprotein